MSKRCRDDEQTDSPPSKRHRGGEVDRVDRLSSLSDEILLHILSFLPIPSLIVCQRYSSLCCSMDCMDSLVTDVVIGCRVDFMLWRGIRNYGSGNTSLDGFCPGHAVYPTLKTRSFLQGLAILQKSQSGLAIAILRRRAKSRIGKRSIV